MTDPAAPFPTGALTPRIPTLALILLLAAGPAAAPLPAAATAACDPASIAILTGEGKARFGIEIADEPDEQARGLMFREELARDAGMLFVFDPPRRAQFWMKNTLIPLDMIFIDDRGRVESVAVRRDTRSERGSVSQGQVRAVLEINAGLSEELGIDAGDQVVHPAFEKAPEDARCEE